MLKMMKGMEEDEEEIEKACVKFEDNDVSCCVVSLLVVHTGREKDTHSGAVESTPQT